MAEDWSLFCENGLDRAGAVSEIKWDVHCVWNSGCFALYVLKIANTKAWRPSAQIAQPAGMLCLQEKPFSSRQSVQWGLVILTRAQGMSCRGGSRTEDDWRSLWELSKLLFQQAHWVIEPRSQLKIEEQLGALQDFTDYIHLAESANTTRALGQVSSKRKNHLKRTTPLRKTLLLAISTLAVLPLSPLPIPLSPGWRGD